VLSDGSPYYNFFNLKFFAFSRAIFAALLVNSLAFYEMFLETPRSAWKK
jgi:hypothetical protein